MHRSEVQQTCPVEEEDAEEPWQHQETTPAATDSVTMRHRDCPSECRADSLCRRWPTRPVSLSSASSSDSGVRGDLSDSSSSRLAFTVASGDSSCCTAWDELDEDDWDSCSDASGEYEPLREPRVTPPYNRSMTHPPAPAPAAPPPPPPPRPPPGTLPRRKNLTRHLGLPSELGGSLAELRAGAATTNRKDIGLFLGMAEPATPPRAGIWRRWASRRGARPEPAVTDTVNSSLPDLARLWVGSSDTISMPATPRRRRAAASPRLLSAALRKVQERALRAVARSGAAEVAGPDHGEPTLIFQAKRGSFEAPSVLFSGERWPAPERPPFGGGGRKLRLPTPPPEPPTPPPTDRLPPPLPETVPAATPDDPAYMTMEAIRALARVPPPRVSPHQDEDESGYLSMDAVQQLVRARRAASPARPRLGSDYANLADLRSALAELRVATGAAIVEDS